MRRRRLHLLPLLVIGFGLILSIAVVSRLAGLDAISKLNESNDNFVRSSQSLILANSLEQRVIDLETGLRGYLVTDECWHWQTAISKVHGACTSRRKASAP